MEPVTPSTIASEFVPGTSSTRKHPSLSHASTQQQLSDHKQYDYIFKEVLSPLKLALNPSLPTTSPEEYFIHNLLPVDHIAGGLLFPQYLPIRGDDLLCPSRISTYSSLHLLEPRLRPKVVKLSEIRSPGVIEMRHSHNLYFRLLGNPGDVKVPERSWRVLPHSNRKHQSLGGTFSILVLPFLLSVLYLPTTMGDKINKVLRHLSNKTRFFSVLDTFSPLPPQQC